MNRKTRRGILKSDFGNNICPLLNKHKPRDPGRIDLLVTLAIQHFRSRQVVGGKKNTTRLSSTRAASLDGNFY